MVTPYRAEQRLQRLEVVGGHAALREDHRVDAVDLVEGADEHPLHQVEVERLGRRELEGAERLVLRPPHRALHRPEVALPHPQRPRAAAARWPAAGRCPTAAPAPCARRRPPRPRAGRGSATASGTRCRPAACGPWAAPAAARWGRRPATRCGRAARPPGRGSGSPPSRCGSSAAATPAQASSPSGEQHEQRLADRPCAAVGDRVERRPTTPRCTTAQASATSSGGGPCRSSVQAAPRLARRRRPPSFQWPNRRGGQCRPAGGDTANR